MKQLPCRRKPGCSFVTTATTPARARYALRSHRCERQRWRERNAANAAARRVAEGPRQECRHTRTHHEHGTHACFVLDRCKCRACRDANTAYENRRRKQRAYGIEAYVDAGPVRAHIEALRAQGLGVKRIAAMAGVPHGGISKIVYGDYGRGMAPSKRVRPTTAAKILAVTANLDNLGGTTGVDAAPTLRRLQALVADGYSITYLGRRLGNSNLHVVFSHDRVYAATARAVRVLYDSLAGVPPRADDQRTRISVSRARNHARDHGWLTGDAWEDIDAGVLLELDDDIDEIVVQRLVDGQQCEASKAERHAAYERLEARGYSARQIAEVLGGTSRTVQRVRARRAS